MLGIVSLGGCLEFYDFAVFIFFASVLNEVFFPQGLTIWLSTVQVWGLLAAGYVFRPFGGLVLAHFGDIFGRKRVFAFSILLMASSTLFMGLLPTYSMVGVSAPLALLSFRALQGIAIGGEVPGAWVFAAEHMAVRNRGLACGAICGGLATGILLASVTATVVTSSMTAEAVREYGWRLPFLLGGVFGLLSFRLRRMLLETPAFARYLASRPLVAELPLRTVIKNQRRALFLSALGTWVLSACVVVVAFLLPLILHNMYGYSQQQVLTGSCVSTIFLGAGVIASGVILDRIGLPAFFIGFGIFLALFSLVSSDIQMVGDAGFYVWSAMIGFSGAVATGAPYLMVSAFPVEVRFTGVSFAYNVSYAIFGGLTPVFITAISYLNGGTYAHYLTGIGVLASLLGGYLLLKPLPKNRE